MLPPSARRCDGARVLVGSRPLAQPCRQCLRRTDIPIDLAERQALQWIAVPPARIGDDGWECDRRIEMQEVEA